MSLGWNVENASDLSAHQVVRNEKNEKNERFFDVISFLTAQTTHSLGCYALTLYTDSTLEVYNESHQRVETHNKYEPE